ncbi:unnamed protein product [Echinostoma caproni]|uniref:Uncharacterized protein n=1 Tax=Echinostoma caproni TaxID=27848 RepID=A0A3P8DCQ6_9TREM|nr:unnamed protein product [Echinostoma caproni]
MIKKALQLNKGDRVCIHGNLGSYPMDLANKVWLQCVVARSICLYHNPPDAEDHEEQLSHEDEAKTYTSSPKASWDSGFESPKGSSS